ncbi:MAG TPA: hypothetical protein VFQ37_09995 [Mycobacterium sp.]|nr:hypothetical protein [Mycobacterium sp.]
MSTETFTELLRHPREVAARTEKGAVRITRRDADDLILVRAGDLERHEEGIALASRLMRATIKCGGDIAAALGELNAWVALLSADEQHQCAEEVGSLMWSAAELGEYRRLLDSFRSWQATAQAYAAGLPRDDDDLTWLPDLPVVARP